MPSALNDPHPPNLLLSWEGARVGIESMGTMIALFYHIKRVVAKCGLPLNYPTSPLQGARCLCGEGTGITWTACWHNEGRCMCKWQTMLSC